MFSNNTTFSFMEHLNKSICNSSSGLCSPFQPCPGTGVHLPYISVMCVVGVVGNILLLYADYKEWKKRQTPDKVLIFSLATSNVAALMTSLPLHAVVVANYADYLKCVGFLFRYHLIQYFLSNLWNFITLGTLVLIGIDRYEALTKFAHQRTLNVKRSIYAIGLVWLASVALVVVFIFTRSMQCTSPFSSRESKTDNYIIIRIVLVSIWITFCCAVTGRSLTMTAERIRKHRQKIDTMFGSAQAAVQISFSKGVFALSLCYIILWIPYGISSALLSSNKDNTTFLCLTLWTNSSCYLGFSALPTIYFIIDTRLRGTVLPQSRVAVTANNNSKTAQRHQPALVGRVKTSTA